MTKHEIKVEIGQYKPYDKGALKGFFTLVIAPHGQKLLDCRYFESNGKRWWTFPQKEITKEGATKKEFIPLVSFIDKGYAESLKEAVLVELSKVATQKTSEESIDWF